LLDELERVVRAEIKRRQENPDALANIPIQQLGQ